MPALATINIEQLANLSIEDLATLLLDPDQDASFYIEAGDVFVPGIEAGDVFVAGMEDGDAIA